MSIEINQLSQLLKATDRQMRHQRELTRIKGETFNIFSILNLESNEVRTHSKFLAELLNPRGSHFMGDLFLKAFLEKIDHKQPFKTDTARALTERGIGLKTPTSGGTVDILIQDTKGNTITIENKIYAGDQKNQILRYYNHNHPKNTVYYLTLQGTEPSKYSTGHLTANQDFHLISYGTTILDWLIRCQEIAVNVAQLREAIKQYYLLIKKLTHQMMDPNSLSIRKLLFEHGESSQYIAENFQNIKNEIKERFRNDVANLLNQKLNDGRVNCVPRNKVSNKGIAQIFVYLNHFQETGFLILIETFSGFSGAHGAEMFIGLAVPNLSNRDFPISGEVNNFDTAFWKAVNYIEIDKKRVNLEDISFLEKIMEPSSEKYQRVLQSFVVQCVSFIDNQYPVIQAYFENKKIEESNIKKEQLS